MKGGVAITDSESTPSKACAMFSNPSSKALTVRVEWLIQSCWRWMVVETNKLLVDDYRLYIYIGIHYVVLPVINRGLAWISTIHYARSRWAWNWWRWPGILGQRWKFATSLLRQDVRVGSQVFGRNFVTGPDRGWVCGNNTKSQRKKAKK